jgi:hypothetical protein
MSATGPLRIGACLYIRRSGSPERAPRRLRPVPLIAYARVSTDEQTTVPQTDVLEPRILRYLSTSGERIAVLVERAGSAGSGT